MPIFLSIFPKMFELKIVTDFASAHSLRNYPGDCARLHGHNWQVEVSVCSKVLDENGIAIIVKKTKKASINAIKTDGASKLQLAMSQKPKLLICQYKLFNETMLWTS